MSPEDLIGKARAATGSERDAYLDQLYRRFYPKVAGWCLSICADVDLASDLAQEALLRVHDRLDTYKVESRFSTWIYRVTRNVVFNRLDSLRRRSALPFEDGFLESLESTGPSAEKQAQISQIGSQLRQVMRRELTPQETRVLYLHVVDGVSLPAITRMLGLTNRSGAKAVLVSAKRKLRRYFEYWPARRQIEVTFEGLE